MKKLYIKILTLIYRLKAKIANPIYYIGGSDNLPEPLTPEEEKELFLRLKTEPKKIRPILIERNLRLVVFIAKKFENTGIGIEDLTSIGSIGLIKGVNTFDPEKQIKLATYASRCIENEILMYIRKINGQKAEVSFDEPLKSDVDGSELLLSDILGTDADLVEKDLKREVDRQIMQQAVEGLNAREREIIELRFGLDFSIKHPDNQEKTQKEVADMLGISQSYISRLEKKIIDRLKHKAKEAS
ncbi:MAG: RNA polymerase sporulation sigma factor SigE [Oscillospiraceae bacterium]|nr:RNA polymerase sporulation sigma factor SigE [Oscillospiraceae bacterium]